MEFISRAFGAFLTLFFDDLPFPLDDPIPQIPNFPKTPAFSRVEQSFFVTPNFERRWNPGQTSTPKISKLASVPKRKKVVPEVKAPPMVAGPLVYGVQLPLESYLLSCKVNGVKSAQKQVPGREPVKRMGLRV